jgi:septal ring factor EnvC (AmiA/AmiB activator)
MGEENEQEKPAAPAEGTSVSPESADQTSGGASETIDDLTELLNEIEKKQARLDNAIRQSKASLSSSEAEQQKLKKDSSLVSRAAESITHVRTDGAAVATEAEKVFKSVEHLVGELEGEVIEEIEDGLAAIDQQIIDAEKKVADTTEELSVLQGETKKLETDVAPLQATYDGALGKLTGLPTEITGMVGAAKKLLAELIAARDAGQARKACVIREDAMRLIDSLKKRSSPDWEQDLLKKLKTAQGELTEGMKELSEKKADLILLEAQLSQRQVWLKNLQNGRKARIQQLSVQKSDERTGQKPDEQTGQNSDEPIPAQGA